jgi:hypothetical protein
MPKATYYCWSKIALYYMGSSKTKAAAGRNCRAEEKSHRREIKKAWVSRKSPLYENCRLLAPDGENTAANVRVTWVLVISF